MSRNILPLRDGIISTQQQTCTNVGIRRFRIESTDKGYVLVGRAAQSTHTCGTRKKKEFVVCFDVGRGVERRKERLAGHTIHEGI